MFLHRHLRVIIAALALLVLFVTYVSIHPRGPSVYVLTIWSNQGTLLGLAAIAQFFVVLVRGVDLSVGSVIALTNVAASYLLVGTPLAIAAGTAVVLALGIICGLANGIIVVYGRIQPIVATLATGSVFAGLALLGAADARRRHRRPIVRRFDV